MDALIGRIASLALHTATGLGEARGQPISLVDAFFGSQAFADYTKGREARHNYATAVLNAIAGVHRAVGVVAEVIARAGRR